ncbi:MAG: phosphatase PAP2 family protein [Pseudonocardia sp.]|nr:phosphatase PAP2 family protein [Pseudonocardia sp.]
MSDPGGTEAARADRLRAALFTGRSVAGLSVLVLGGVCFAVLVALVESQAPVLAFDRRITAWLNSAVAGHQVLVAALEVITALGGPVTGTVVMTTLWTALLIRRQWRLAGFVAVAGLGALVLSPTVKLLVGRLRPMVGTQLVSVGGPSFPSGHALGSLVVYGVLLLVVLPVLGRRARRLVTVAVAVLVLAIGFTRLALGVHFLTDVLAGWLLGLGWLTVTTVAFRAWRRDAGLPAGPVERGLAPETGAELAPAAAGTGPVLPRPWRQAATLLIGWVLLLGVLLGTGWLVTVVLPGTAVDAADIAVVRWLAEHRTPTATTLATLVGRLGSTPVVLALSFAAAVLALALTRRWRPVLFLAVVMAGEVTLFLVTATVISRPRPPVEHLGPALPTAGFPSGHTSAAISFYGAVAVVVLTRTRGWWRWLVLAAAVLIAASVALSRLYSGVHYPSDVLGSALLAVPWLVACWYVLRPGAGGDRR